MTDYPTAIDLCAGCGGFSFGAQNVGFNVRAAFEIAPAPWYTYKVHIADHDDMALLSHDVTDVDLSKAPDDLDAVFGGPSCQPFSDAQGEHFDGNPRETVAFAVFRWVAELRPKVAAIENVGGLKKNHPRILGLFLDELRDAGYAVATVELNAADYRVPQKRDRIFVLAVRGDLNPPATWEPPAVRTDDPGQARLTLGDDLDGYRTAGDALDDLPRPLSPQRPKNDPVHSVSPYDANRVTPHSCGVWMDVNDGQYVLGPQGGIRGDVLMPPNHVEADHERRTREEKATWPLGYCGRSTTDRRLDPDDAAPTMTVSDGHPPFHYAGKTPSNDAPVSDVRRLTVREVARLQTFPDHWCFAGTKKEQFRQVANAVPPLLAAHVADHLRTEVIEDSDS